MINLENFYLNNNTKNIISKWETPFKNKNNIKPLFINSNKGTGKTTLANLLLNEYSIITIDTNIINISEYIRLIISKKDISMLFSNKKYKAIIIDDIFINNKYINNFFSFFEILKRNTNNPIIILNSNKFNKLETIKNQCYSIELEYEYNIFLKLLII